MAISNVYQLTHTVVNAVAVSGIQGMGTNDDDFVEHLLNTSTHDTILFFTSKGRVFRTKGYQVPEFNRTAKGLPIINLLGVDKEEKVTAMIPVDKFEGDNTSSS